MTREQLLKALNINAEIIWGNLAEMYPKLVKYNPPKIILCARLWRTGGKCHWEDNQVTLGYKFFAKYPEYMNRVILPHEIIHQAHYDIYGGVPPEKEWHSGLWAEIMVNYGLPADEFHTMNIARK